MGLRSLCSCLIFSALCASGQDHLALVVRATSDFERVELAARPSLQDTIACVQSQAAVLPVARFTERHLVHYRKGYCTLVGAGLNNDRAAYQDAAAEFEHAIASWPTKNPSLDQVTSGLRILAAVARLGGGRDPDIRSEVINFVERELRAALNPKQCPGTLLMSTQSCENMAGIGRLWLGWIENRKNNLAEAARFLETAPESGWTPWVQGRRHLEQGRYVEAVSSFDKALRSWLEQERKGYYGLAGLLGPRPDVAQAQYQLAEAQFLTQEYQAAVDSLEQAIKKRPQNAQAIFLRARAKELLGMAQPALADYELASRTAFANVGAPAASGQAHLYRGIWLFRRKDYERAENAFASALNFDPGERAKADAIAWRHMAAVASGSCGVSSEGLRSALVTTSELFPRSEAQALLQQCGPLRSEPTPSRSQTRERPLAPTQAAVIECL